MTNADKYLKEGVSVEEFLQTYCMVEGQKRTSIMTRCIEEFLNTDIRIKSNITPTLTEDERVILRNIQKGLFREGFISRTAGNELFVFIKETGETIELYIFNHLFQFIKERRRIFY